MNKARLARILAIIILLIAAAWFVRSYLNPPANHIEASGTIETTEVDVSFQAAGRVQELLVQEGDHVTQGQVIARLDAQPLRESLERSRAQLDSAKVLLAQQRDALVIAERTLGDQERAARASLEAARALRDQARTGPRVQEVGEAEAALSAAVATLAKAQLDLERARELVKRGVYSKAALDAAEAAYRSAESQRDSAQQRLDMLKEGTRKEQIDSAEAQFRQAQAAHDLAGANLLQIRLREKDVQVAEMKLQDAQAACNIAQINFDYAQLKAPVSGWVLLKNIEAGEVVNVGTPVFTLGDIADLWMNVYIGEKEVGRLRLGDPVTIQVDAYPNETFEGKVIFISQEAEFTPKNIQTKDERTKLVYRVKVSIRNQDQKLKPGMPADAELVPSIHQPEVAARQPGRVPGAQGRLGRPVR